MNLRDNSADGIVVELSRAEATVMFGCLVEAMEALSESEFEARIGHPEGDAEVLAAALKRWLVE